jgi:hypothetical protein
VVNSERVFLVPSPGEEVVANASGIASTGFWRLDGLLLGERSFAISLSFNVRGGASVVPNLLILSGIQFSVAVSHEAGESRTARPSQTLVSGGEAVLKRLEL